jgi:hypothetical protein
MLISENYKGGNMNSLTVKERVIFRNEWVNKGLRGSKIEDSVFVEIMANLLLFL